MDTLDRIDKLYEKIEVSPLSLVLPQISSLSLEVEEYEDFCILFLWNTSFGPDSTCKREISDEVKKYLLQEGVENEAANRIIERAFSNYLKMRSVGNDQVCVSSAKEMEDEIAMFSDMLNAVEVPDGLHPVDLYYRSKTAQDNKLKIIESRRIIEQRYAALQDYVTSRLAYYRRKVNSKERKQLMEQKVSNSKEVFIIHGHSESKRRELKELLKERFGLEPIVLSEQPDQGLTIIEKFEKYASNCAFAFALFTPDDIVTNGGKQYFQARPNVIFELGWFYANLGRSRVCILEQESEKSEIFSDLQGVMRMQFKENISEKYLEIERELRTLGIIK